MPAVLTWLSQRLDQDAVLVMKTTAATRTPESTPASDGLMDAALAAACTIGIEARAYFGSRPWAEIEPALSTCWARNYARLRVDWLNVAEMAYTAWSYDAPRLMLSPQPPCREMAS